MNADEIRGVANDAVGKVKDAAGGLTGDSALQAEGKVDQAAGKIQGQYEAVKDDLSRAAGTVSDNASEFAGAASGTIRDAAQTMRDQAGRVGEKVYAASSEVGDYMGGAVQQQPLLSLIGAAAIGYVIGFVIYSSVSPLAAEPKRKRYSR